MNPRSQAAKILIEVIQNKHSLSSELAAYQQNELRQKEPALVKALCFGVVRWYFRLTFILKQLLPHPLKNKDSDINNLLLIGLFQLLYLRIPGYAAVTETVNAARDLKKDWACKLINGVLRNFLRNQSQLLTQCESNLACEYAHPEWLIKTIKTAWPLDWKAALSANNLHPPLSLRINNSKISTAAYLEQLSQHQLAGTSSQITPQAVILDQASDIKELPGYQEGHFSVQDEAAQLAPSLLELSPDLWVLDACAAPGGKTTHMLELEPNLAGILAIDEDERRLNQAKENSLRLQLPSRISWQVADAANPESWWDGRLFDRILLDAPCSATGVIRRHPDIKLLRRPNDIAALIVKQHALLNALWPLLKKGGLLLYATCSILPQENDQVISQFLEQHADASLKPIKANWGRQTEVGRQILPGENGMDGFFYGLIFKSVA